MFFAVATEFFLDKPSAMKRHEPELYELLRSFYGQDTAARATRKGGHPPSKALRPDPRCVDPSRTTPTG